MILLKWKEFKNYDECQEFCAFRDDQCQGVKFCYYIQFEIASNFDIKNFLIKFRIKLFLKYYKKIFFFGNGGDIHHHFGTSCIS